MRSIKGPLFLVMIVLGAMVSSPAFAHGPHVRFGFVIGGPVYGPWYYPPPYYYYPPTVIMPSAPTTYIERGIDEASESQQRQGDWFYCADPRGYYPYVKKCPGGWQRVASEPPPGP